MMHRPSERLHAFCLQALACERVRLDVASHVADVLVDTSLRGIDSHGIRLLPHYMRAVAAGRINRNPRYRFEQTGPATGRWDADHTFGHAAAIESMQQAILMAHESGMGMVTAYNSTHCGAVGFYAMLAAQKEMIGLSFTHADALMLSPSGVRPYFGTNPISVAAPCAAEEPFCFDAATSLATWNKVLQFRARGEPLPPGWAADVHGQETTNAAHAAAVLPMGDYKGFGLGMIVDIFCGVLTGMPFGRAISSMFKAPIGDRRYLGHALIAIDIERFCPVAEFSSRLQQMMNEVRAEPASSTRTGVQVPGDPEKRIARQRRSEGIPLADDDLKGLQEMAAQYGIAFP